MVRIAMLVLTIVGVVACGGRKASPVSTVRATDAHLSCDHLAAERKVNLARIADLTREAKAADQNNAGLVVVNPLFLDLTDVEQQEIRALQARNVEIGRLSAARPCPD